ncbi:MAG TPA: hypothetical protein VES65_05200 [Solirubrobacteraceae bacterium]|nr:hypothetical protein [Solirubrobacteraceae bacterium]
MSHLDLSAGQSGRVGFTPASGAPDVKWIRPDTLAYLPPPMSKSAVRERTERANALIVIMLTLACTALALYDLFLLALGS